MDIEYQILSEYHIKIGTAGYSILDQDFIGFDEALKGVSRGA
jgi:hypothetical protein